MPNDSPVTKAREMARIKTEGEADAKGDRIFTDEAKLTFTSAWVDEEIRREARREVEAISDLAQEFACIIADQDVDSSKTASGSRGDIIAAEAKTARGKSLKALLEKVKRTNIDICNYRAEAEARIAAYQAGAARRAPGISKLRPVGQGGMSIPGPREALCGIDASDGAPKPRLPSSADDRVSLLALPTSGISGEGALPAPGTERQGMLLKAPNTDMLEEETEARRMT